MITSRAPGPCGPAPDYDNRRNTVNRLYLRTSAALLALSLAGQLSLPLLAAPAGHFGAFVVSQAAAHSADVEISEQNFPDPVF